MATVKCKSCEELRKDLQKLRYILREKLKPLEKKQQLLWQHFDEELDRIVKIKEQ